MSYQLGKQAATADRRDFLWADLAPEIVLPSLPSRFGHADLFKGDMWLMFGNGPDDTVEQGFQGAGDCVWAGFAHEERMLHKVLHGSDVLFTGANVISDYSAATGYQIDVDSTDQGTNVRDAEKYRQATGIVDAHGKRHKIGAYVALDPGNWQHLLEATYIFGAVGIGFSFPYSAWQQFDEGQPWDVAANDGGIDGGHYVPVMGTPHAGIVGLVTWARRQEMTRAFYEKYNDESWVYVDTEELKRDGTGLHGFDLAKLNGYLAALRG